MKTRRIVIAVLMATLLVSAALIVGCMSQLDGISGEDTEDNYQAPEGKGIVRLKVADIDKKLTILPDNTTANGVLLQDMYFDVQFINTSNASDFVWFPGLSTTTQPAKKASYDDFYNVPIALTAGKIYKFVITAYDDDDGTTPIAGYTSNTINTGTIGSSTTNLGPYNLLPLINSLNTGTFNYSITIPTNTYDTKTLVITKHDGSSSGVGPITLNENNSPKTGSESLPSGYYFVTVTIGKTYYLTQIYKEALHIYPAMPSNWELDTTDTPLVQNVFQVTFSNSKGASPATQDVTYAGKAETPSPAPTATNFSFDGWFDAPTGGNQWNFSNNRILSSRTLYAYWTADVIPGVEFDITFTYDDLMDNLVGSTNSCNITVGSFDGSSTVVLTLGSAPSDFSWVNITWTMEGGDLSTSNGTNTATVSNSTSFLSALAGTSFKVIVSAKLKPDSAVSEPPVGYPVYSATVTVNVTH